MTQPNTLSANEFRNHPQLGNRQRQYFVGIIERDTDAVIDALGEQGGFVEPSGNVLRGDSAREALIEVFRDGGLEYFDLSVHEGIAFSSFRGALTGRACWIETENSLTEFPIS